MFGLGKIKTGDYVFAVEPENEFKRIILGRVQSVNNNSLLILGSFIKPLGLISKVQKGVIGKRSQEVLNDPDPNNCIFILIDRIETGNFYGNIDQSTNKVIGLMKRDFLSWRVGLKRILQIYLPMFYILNLKKKNIIIVLF